jgi:hypothetical protein
MLFDFSLSRYILGFLKCTFGFGSVPAMFLEIGEWLWRFPKGICSVVAVGVAVTI